MLWGPKNKGSKHPTQRVQMTLPELIHRPEIGPIHPTNIVSFPRPPDEAATALRDLGFSSIIVPFYGNPHFVREGLHLRPVYQDRWLQAYPLAPR